MLKQFYNYLSEKVIKFFNENKPAAASRFDIQFEEEEQVKNLYESLRNSQNSKVFQYKSNLNEIIYESYEISFGEIDLIVAATIDNIQADFLTTLRNLVGTKGYENKAILFIHNTTLDSIVNGAESFNKKGMPFHVDSITIDLKSKLSSSTLENVDKEIIEFELEKKKTFSDDNSIFEYKELLNIINKPCIEKINYRDFGLFYDDELESCSGKKLKKRLMENAKYYELVSESHSYGTLETQLEKYFDEKGIEKLKEENWRDVKYSTIKKSIDNKNSKEPLKYSENLICNVEAWDRAEGSSKSKSRIRNIIVFNNENKETIEIEVYFEDYLQKEHLKPAKNAKAITSGKKIKITLSGNTEEKFSQVTYVNEDKVKFDFRILIVNFESKYFKGIETNYSIQIKKKEILLNTNEEIFIFGNGIEENILEIKDGNQLIEIFEDKKNEIKLSEDFEYEDNGVGTFKIRINNQTVKLSIQGINEKKSIIDGFKVWKLKREKNKSFEYISENKLKLGTIEYSIKEEFRKNLELEKLIVENESLAYDQYEEELVAIELTLGDKLVQSYKNIIDYMRKTESLPSLSAIEGELEDLYNNYVYEFIEELNSVKEGDYLSKGQKDLFKLGTLKREFADRELLLTPLNPLNIAYQLLVKEKLGNSEIEENCLKKLTSTYLLPYVSTEDDNIYIPIEQHHSPEWNYYVDEKLPRYKGSRDFVSKLVLEKIEEFKGHFKYLFEFGSNVPLKINLFNTGDSKEILQGIFNYYVKQLKQSKEKNIKINPMEIYIYSDKNIVNAFEEVAYNENIEELKNLYNLNFNLDNTTTEEDVMNLFREKVQFYSKKLNEQLEYAHLTFLEIDDDVKSIISNMDDINSGTILTGLISGVPSVFLGDNYRTGFGTKYIDDDSMVITIAKKLNSLNAALTGAPFSGQKCKMVSVSNSSKNKLEQIYNNSNWVTFINPKVDLNFFKNDPNSTDLLIIHYSDQYTSAGGYDAITVTRKSIPYQKVIEEFLESKKVENYKKSTVDVINTFNAINGDWLLRLISRKSNFSKEKISILSAIKLALAYFETEKIIWIPISLEEILRVSGGAGLKKSEGFFSAKNLGFDAGATSDDILLIGIEENQGNVKVHYYPIEVKIGINDNSYINKGIEQVNKTKDLLVKTLGINEEYINYDKKIYRNFLMQLAVTSAEKLKLYNVGNLDNWEKIVNSDIRQKMLNENYEISLELEKVFGRGAVISFKAGNVCFNESHLKENINVIEYTEEDGINYITKEIEEIRAIITKDFSNNIIENKNVINYECNNVSEYENNNIDLNVNNNTNNIVDDIQDKIIDIKTDKSFEAREVLEFIKIEQVAEKGEEILFKNEKIEENKSIEILFGENQKNGELVNWYLADTDKTFHTNTGIIGQMGTGKTQFTKSVITQLYRESKYNLDGKNIGILIFDYKGDYNANKTDFIEATNAKVYPLYRLPFNPLSIVKAKIFKPMLPLHVASSLTETITKAFRLGVKQSMALKDVIMQAYENKGIEKANPSTWSNTAPTLNDVYNLYLDSEGFKEDSLYAALKNLAEFEIFEIDGKNTKSLFELIDGVTVIDLSGYDPSIQNLVVAITLDLFYSQMQAEGHSKIEKNIRQLNKIILVDEADNFLSEDFTSIKKILKEGREFGVGTILSTQLLSHFSTGDNDYANYILTWIVHSVTDINSKDVKFIFNTQSKSDDEQLCNKIKSLSKHYSLVKMGGNDAPIFIKDKAFWELIK